MRQEIPATDVRQLVQEGRRQPLLRPVAGIGGQEDDRPEDAPGHRDLARRAEDQPHRPAQADLHRQPADEIERRGIGHRRRVAGHATEAQQAEQHRDAGQEHPGRPGDEDPGLLPR